MRTVILASALLAIATAFPIVHQTTFDGPVVPEPNRTCTPMGNKCAGAANQPFVQYAPCCASGDVCGELIKPVTGLWGLFCGPPSEVKAVAIPSPTTTVTGPTTTASPSSSVATTETPVPAASPANSSALTSPSPSPKSNGSSCFPASATVELLDGTVMPMIKLSVGDKVKVGPNAFSEVFMFTHKLASGEYDFVQLTTASGAALSLSGGHYIPVDGSLVAASEVKVGSHVILSNGNADRVVSIRNVVESGLFNPQTVQGNIVVNGVVASTYTTAVEPRFAHAILSPLRSLFNLFGHSIVSLESGGGFLADAAPRGDSLVC